MAGDEEYYCPLSHPLRLWQADEGSCDMCGVKVAAGTPVMDCRICNWYICRSCYPMHMITKCNEGHFLRPWAAPAGNCDMCGYAILSGEVVMDCRACDWFLCAMCRPNQALQGCRQGHALRPWVAPAGDCDGCGMQVQKGQVVMDCRRCDFFLCPRCCPGFDDCNCPSGHRLRPWAVSRGNCHVCRQVVHAGEVVMDCRHCGWYMCSLCQASWEGPPVGQEHIELLRRKFASLDRDGNGRLSFDELRNLLRQGNPHMTDRELRLLFNGVDSDRNGEIDFSEFLEFVFATMGDEGGDWRYGAETTRPAQSRRPASDRRLYP